MKKEMGNVPQMTVIFTYNSMGVDDTITLEDLTYEQIIKRFKHFQSIQTNSYWTVKSLKLKY